ncbi:MAG: DNA polymerase III subunit alpha [Anaerolineae bacterium]|jgi:DNA polymerase-3 subunit alpha|nr:DNA polymerase III subunit alpha [Anaerolineae bacterium]MBT4309054.1 DNA polymerase III subunit alpha [Anaerolineae bacterium]MBT4460034.1 DNA polymerase III subunit alpha [Anaerolineae bacterium]MBT6059843.1 DNA polymerase III subunit alpha [Anaerolineae bacterium]MBT6324094.1 DNA polymerase III subunit alpha [Anaerolineae bacterium]
MSFAHLHVHTEYSLLDGLSNIEKLVATAKAMDMPAVAITDHGTMFGVKEFYDAAKAVDIKPIIGVEAYMAARGMTDRDSKLDKKSSHLLLLAKNDVGYRNLLKITSAAQTEGFYYRPRIDREFLAAHAEGLIATSGCMSAEIPRALLREDPEEAVRRMDWYYDVFGEENFYVELQQHNIVELTEINRKLVEMGARYTSKFVATNDVHYIKKDDAKLQDILLAIQTGALLKDEKRMRMDDPSYYFRSPQEMYDLFKEVPESLTNTLEIAERCNVDLDFKEYHLPHFDVPDGHTEESYLRHLCEKGLEMRYGKHSDDKVIRDRLNYELDVIHTMGFDAYFIIVWDLVREAQERDILYTTRGSAAGSIVAYALEITLIDPIEHDLIFERFLNPGRISMPDIDLDFRDDRRQEIMAYCAEKYGDDKVAQIITFGTMGAKAAIRDVARVMDIPLHEVNQIAKLIPAVSGKKVTIEGTLKDVPDFKKAYNSAPHIRELIDTAIGMEGVVRNAGTHAAGVVIADKPLIEYLPIHRPTSNSEDTPIKTVTQFEMGILDAMGMLKVDFLGLSTLTVIARAATQIEKRYGKKYHLENIPLDDAKAFEIIGEGNTAGIFQLEGGGMTGWMVKMQPTMLDHVIAMVALYRPGPMRFIPSYIERMNGREEVTYRHPSMEPIFKSTYGIPIYQEQIMRSAVELGGYSGPESDNLRKAISKKKEKEIARHRQKFIDGSVENGIERNVATNIFDDWEEFARYGFNKSHAAAYGTISVQTAYLKANYPTEYMTALMSVFYGVTAKVSHYAANAREMGIEILPPSVNKSEWDFAAEYLDDGKTAIRFGFGAIKNVGRGPVEALIEAREGKDFTDINEFIRAVDLRAIGKRALEAMVKVGALDIFGDRSSLIASLDRLIAVSTAHFKAKDSGQISMFGSATGISDEIILSPGAEIEQRIQLGWERELIGIYVSDHPLSGYQETFSKIRTHTASTLPEAAHESRARVAGIIAGVRPYQTKTGKPMGFVTLDDMHGIIELVIFPRTWQQYRELCEEGKIVIIEGKVDANNTPPKILVDSIKTDFNIVSSVDEKPQTHMSEPAPVKKTSSPVVKSTAPPPPVKEKVAEPAATYTVKETPPPPVDDGFDTTGMPPQPEAFPEDWEETVYEADYAEPVDVAMPEPPPESPQGEQAQTEREADSVEREVRKSIPNLDLFAESESQHPPRLITVAVRPNGSPERDKRRLKNIHGVLISFPGGDKFSLQIFEGHKGHLIDFPNYNTRICDEMLARLKTVMGSEEWRIEEIGG